MTQTLLIFFTALTFSMLGTPLARRLALYTGVVDAPAARKIHSAPVPLLGGAAIYGNDVVLPITDHWVLLHPCEPVAVAVIHHQWER